ncbi:MAG: ABC transporter ATP-binding protein [Saprospiraceae bacterium]|nr:ABC transporter ATP-binding protein [Saprospiraceae bacterium]
MSILSGRNLHKRYDQLHVLKGVDIEVERGEIVAIAGKSGAGKSTLLHILGTLDPPDEGEVIIAGTRVRDLGTRSLAHFRNARIGFVFQFHHLLNEFTALENVCIPAMIRGERKAKAQVRASDLLSYLGLRDRLDHKPAELSGGEQQRVAVARALMNQPDLILADEPTGNLDTENSEEIHALFVQLRDDFGQTFIIVTHNEQLADMSDRKLVMQDGVFIDT